LIQFPAEQHRLLPFGIEGHRYVHARIRTLS